MLVQWPPSFPGFLGGEVNRRGRCAAQKTYLKNVEKSVQGNAMGQMQASPACCSMRMEREWFHFPVGIMLRLVGWVLAPP